GRAKPPVYDRARAAARYSATMRELIQSFKYRDRHEGLPLLGLWLKKAGSPASQSIASCSPACGARKAKLGSRPTSGAGTSPGPLGCRPHSAARVKGKNVIVVDDVITTGATAEACARALKRAGAARVDVLALARAVEPTAFLL